MPAVGEKGSARLSPGQLHVHEAVRAGPERVFQSSLPARAIRVRRRNCHRGIFRLPNVDRYPRRPLILSSGRGNDLLLFRIAWVVVRFRHVGQSCHASPPMGCAACAIPPPATGAYSRHVPSPLRACGAASAHDAEDQPACQVGRSRRSGRRRPRHGGQRSTVWWETVDHYRLPFPGQKLQKLQWVGSAAHLGQRG